VRAVLQPYALARGRNGEATVSAPKAEAPAVLDPSKRRAPAQGEYVMKGGRPVGRTPNGTIAWSEHLEAFERYAEQHGRDQSVERIAERGGFGVNELRTLLGREPSTFEAGDGE
jgi:hypothetical protein